LQSEEAKRAQAARAERDAVCTARTGIVSMVTNVGCYCSA
jgi:hypothetical protein